MKTNLLPYLAIACFVFVVATCAILVRQNMVLMLELAQAAEQIQLQEKVSQSAGESLAAVRERENELREQRKKLGEKLEAAACVSGPAYIDALMELLGEDYKKRCD